MFLKTAANLWRSLPLVSENLILDPVVSMNPQKNCLVDPDPHENSDPDPAAYKLVLIAKSQGSLLRTRKIVRERRVRQNFLNMWVTDSAWCCPDCLITIVSLKDACHFFYDLDPDQN
jgi:hypothetical protein